MAERLARKDLLLLLLYSPGSSGDIAEPIVGRTRLMKLLFLLQAEAPVDKLIGAKRAYRFQAYHYGPFTKDVYDDLEFLENVGLITVSAKGEANSADQTEAEKVVEDTTIGEDQEETSWLFPEERFRLTDRGRQFVESRLIPAVPPDFYDKIYGIKNRFASAALTSLLRYVYSAYPDFAKNSKLKDLVSAE